MPDTLDNSQEKLKQKRPVLVWVIFFFYLFAAVFTAFSIATFFSGRIPINQVQKEYFDSMTVVDHGTTALISISNLLGAIFLFILRKHAFHLFLAGFVTGLLTTIYHIVAKNWIEAVGTAGFIVAVFGWLISISIILYSKRLTSRGVLK